MDDNVNLPVNLLKKILQQLVISDGMEITNQYWIKEKIYYVDNVGIIEELEKIILSYYYDQLKMQNPSPTQEELFELYNPTYINSDKYWNELTADTVHGIVEEDKLPLNKQKKLSEFF